MYGRSCLHEAYSEVCARARARPFPLVQWGYRVESNVPSKYERLTPSPSRHASESTNFQVAVIEASCGCPT